MSETQNPISSSNLSELKAGIEKALDDRKTVDARIDEIREAIYARLQEARELSDTVDKLTKSILPKKKEKFRWSFTVNWRKWWQLFLKFFLPVLVLIILVWFSMVHQFGNSANNTNLIMSQAEADLTRNAIELVIRDVDSGSYSSTAAALSALNAELPVRVRTDVLSQIGEPPIAELSKSLRDTVEKIKIQ